MVVAKSACLSAEHNGRVEVSLSFPIAPETELTSAASSRDSPVILHIRTRAKTFGAHSQNSTPPPPPSAFPDMIVRQNHLAPSGQSKVDDVTQSRADCAHNQEFAGPGSEVCKVPTQILHGSITIHPFFSRPLLTYSSEHTRLRNKHIGHVLENTRTT